MVSWSRSVQAGGEDFNNIFPESQVGVIQKALRCLGIVCGTLGLTASEERVLFFFRIRGEESGSGCCEEKDGTWINHILTTLSLIMNFREQSSITQDGKVQWEIRGQNYVVAFMEHHIQQQNRVILVQRFRSRTPFNLGIKQNNLLRAVPARTTAQRYDDPPTQPTAIPLQLQGSEMAVTESPA